MSEPQRSTAALQACALVAHIARQCELRPGLRLHGDDAVDATDASAEGCCAPGLHLVLLLEGRLDLSYGDRRVMLGTSAQKDEAGSFLLNVSHPEQFTRRTRRGRYARRVSLSVSHEWLDQLRRIGPVQPEGPLENLLANHLAMQSWRPTARAIALSEQLLRPPAYAPLLQGLYLESRLLDLLSEALAPLQAGDAADTTPHAESGPAPSATVARRMRELREFLHNEATLDLSLDDIARRAGMSANVLQAQFRRVYGTTVFAFLRDSRLQRAREALERDGQSIKQAAHLAGYTTAANFSTAFSRRFALTPKQARNAARR